MSHPILKIEDLNKSYDTGKSKLHVLKGINLTINQGEFVSIMGSSGSGKSTLLNIIGILDEADSGVYELDGFPIKHLTEVKAAEYRSRFLGFIFQSFNLINYKTALDNVALPLYYQNIFLVLVLKGQTFFTFIYENILYIDILTTQFLSHLTEKKGHVFRRSPASQFRKTDNQSCLAGFALCDSFSLMRADLPERSRR